jgi:hypothetical protein
MALCTCGDDNVVTRRSGPHVGEYCASCCKWLRWVPQGIENFVWPIGAKHKGTLILTIARIDRPYLEWAAKELSSPTLKAKAKEALRYHQDSQDSSQYDDPEDDSPPW